MKKFITGILIKTIIFSSLTYGVVHAAEWQIQNELRKQDVHCLALNIYYETKAVSLADAMAVSDVVLNRVNSRHYPNTACTVIKEGKQDANGNMIRHKCQFSWYCDGKSDNPRNIEAWERAQKFAHDIYIYGEYVGLTEGATHYHATYVRPKWAPNMDRITRIGSHYFYRMK